MTTETPEEPIPVSADQRWTGRARVVSPREMASPLRTSPPLPPEFPPTGPPPGGGRGPGGRRRRPRWGRIALITSLAVLLVAGSLALTGYLWIQHVNDNLKRTESLDDMVHGQRPVKTVDGALNILLLGSDSRDP